MNWLGRARLRERLGLTRPGHRRRLAPSIAQSAVALGGAAVLGFMLPAPPALAQQSWTGANSTDWFDGGNWIGGVPGVGNSPTIDTTTPNSTLVNGAATANLTVLTIGYDANGVLTLQNATSMTDGFLGYNAGSAGAASVTGAGSAWHTDHGTFVGYGGTGTFNVLSGGAVTNINSYLGYFAGSLGTVTVNNATWITSQSVGPPTDGQIFVGYGGTGVFNVTNAGIVNSVDTYVGHLAGSNGTVNVDGASSWTNSGSLYVGNYGTGTFNLTGGNVSVGGDTVLGYNTGSVGTATVDGATSTWTTTGNTFVGGNSVPADGGTGIFNVSNGGTVNANQDTLVGGTNGSIGTVNVNTGGIWNQGGDLYVGYLGVGALHVASGGGVTVSGDTYIGVAGAATNTVTVSGPGSTFNGTGFISVGGISFGGPGGGIGVFNVADGGTVSFSDTFLGNSAGSSGTATVTGVNGASSSWTTSAFTAIGFEGTGLFNVTDGGQVNAFGTYLAYNPGSFGTVNVTGMNGATSSRWTNTSDLIVGEQGPGGFNVLNGGYVDAQTDVYLGDCFCGVGTVNVSGVNGATPSTWSTGGRMYVGFQGTGVVNVTNGGNVVVNGDTLLGNTSGSFGTVNVSGVGSTWTSNSIMGVGKGGTGTFNVSAGGTVNAGPFFAAGIDSGSAGAVTVTGVGSSWNGSGISYIGELGTGEFNVLNGATAELGDLYVGIFGGTGTLRADATSQVTGFRYTQGSTGAFRVGLNQANNGRVTLTGGGGIDLTGGGGGGGALVVDAKTTAARTYTIMSTDAAVAGTFDTVTVFGNANNLQVHYNADSITLSVDTFSLATLLPSGLTGNPKNVATGIDNAILAGNTFPDPFFDLFALSGKNLVNALTQLSGENATGGALAGNQLMTSFLSLLLNPFSGAPNGNPGTLGFARDFGAGEKPLPPEAALAYAAVTPKDRRADPFDKRWGIWGAAYGGYNKSDGDVTTVSHDTVVRIYGLATGFDYRASADLMVGFALAGAGTSWGLSNNLGTGRSDVMQLGLYGSKQFGASYLSGALSYAWHSINTDRTVTVSGSDHLAANVDAHSFGGRIETGHHFVTAFAGVTPYAALQAQIFHTPSYSETAVSGSSAFALSYVARSTVATRTELGVWLDKTLPLDHGKVLALRAQAAWANDHSNHQGVDATFQSLPASTFTVNGAAPATNLALLTAGTELRLTNNVSLGAKLGGEFSSRTQTYSGTGTFRYVW